jgi:hypothetical protein
VACGGCLTAGGLCERQSPPAGLIDCSREGMHSPLSLFVLGRELVSNGAEKTFDFGGEILGTVLGDVWLFVCP